MYIGNDRLVVVSERKCLDMICSTKLGTNAIFRDLSTRAKSAVIDIVKTMLKINYTSCNVFFKLSGMGDCDIIEGVLPCAVKRVLDVSMQTPNALVHQLCFASSEILDENSENG